MTTSLDLLLRGYFPDELPPAFYALDFASKLHANLAHFPNMNTGIARIAKATTFNLFRVGNLRRQISIPNPILHFRLCQEIETSWGVLNSFVQQSAISRSTPVIGPASGRALITTCHQRDLLPEKAGVRGISKYLLVADIARFYPSIYTHSIPWALHTKTTAKANHGNGLLGNRLDTLVRNSQDGQTIGIPIGPVTSLLLSEIILTAVDQLLITRLPALRGFRFVDDYELGFISLGAAEEGLAVLQECLTEYELELGADKTKIEDLPKPLDSDWVAILRNFQFRTTSRGQFSDIADYFDRAFRYAREYPRESVLNYALTRFSNFQCDPANWTLLQNLLFECLMVESSTIIKVFSAIYIFRRNGHQVNGATFESILNEIITRHANLGHSSEVAWALWAIIVFGYQVSQQAAQAISRLSDSIVAILALDAQNRGLIPGGLNIGIWQTYMSTYELYGEHWLLSYEANIKGWLPSNGMPDHVTNDRNFAFLKNLGVEFYNSQRGIAAVPTFVSPSLQTAPLFSITAP